ncbi:uncharacterized protein LOC111266799 isoform X2 [Varroa jacobsoni]|uniref:uncharacterized protein LOC111266799 isoform X2 n=1 Tax=Varroa jacobsoni TaxID=62625 RepID=UPI000BF41EFF|nr:uncharacterized protein LOC111266799 isoform X2 [Varroa jacobsoni]
MKMFRMKRLAYIFGLISLLWYTKIGYVTGYTSAAQENSENEEEIGVCGPVPNHGRMMAVLKPMSHVVLCTVNRIIDFGASIRAVQNIIEKFCLTFDTCVPTGKLSSNKGTNPEVVCLKEHILQEFLKHASHVAQHRSISIDIQL